MVTAIVLIKAETNRIPDLADQIADMDGVSEVFSVAGRYDLVALVRVTKNEELADVISDKMRLIAQEHGPEKLVMLNHGAGSSHFRHLMRAYGSDSHAEPAFAQCRGPRDVGFVLTFGESASSPERTDMANSRCIVLIGSHIGENLHNAQVQTLAEALHRGGDPAAARAWLQQAGQRHRDARCGPLPFALAALLVAARWPDEQRDVDAGGLAQVGELLEGHFDSGLRRAGGTSAHQLAFALRLSSAAAQTARIQNTIDGASGVTTNSPTAPPASERPQSGTTSSGSKPSRQPKPSQIGQAP